VEKQLEVHTCGAPPRETMLDIRLVIRVCTDVCLARLYTSGAPHPSNPTHLHEARGGAGRQQRQCCSSGDHSDLHPRHDGALTLGRRPRRAERADDQGAALTEGLPRRPRRASLAQICAGSRSLTQTLWWPAPMAAHELRSRPASGADVHELDPAAK
jgi:hypothetical protein